MCPVSLTVWFACKSCNMYFAKVDDFIEHKKESHLTEFQVQNKSCVVFEERTDEDFDIESGMTYSSVETTQTILKEEFQLARLATDSRIETNLEPNIVSSFDDQNLLWQIADGDLTAQANNFVWNSELKRVVLVSTTNGRPQPCQTVENFTAQTNEYVDGSLEPIEATLELKTELVTYKSQRQEKRISSVGSFLPQHNPFVLLKRLTSKEITEASRATKPKMNFKKHLKSHFVRKPFKCLVPTCGKAYAHQGSLYTHKRSSHSNARPFGCPHCDKTYQFRHHLAHHLRIHTGDQPYKFPVDHCGKSFAKSTTVSRHKKWHQIKL